MQRQDVHARRLLHQSYGGSYTIIIMDDLKHSARNKHMVKDFIKRYPWRGYC